MQDENAAGSDLRSTSSMKRDGSGSVRGGKTHSTDGMQQRDFPRFSASNGLVGRGDEVKLKGLHQVHWFLVSEPDERLVIVPTLIPMLPIFVTEHG